jgi:DMSO/TMAO reductase YedYZ molybdopterin-dependent catalytic subunit
MQAPDPDYQAEDAPIPDGVDADVIVSPDTRRGVRIPPGQRRTRKWPVLHAGRVPEVDTSQWDLRVSGLVEREARWNWDEFHALPRVRVFSDFHCVTHWSRLGNLWEGVSVREVMRHAPPRPDARYVLVHAEDGWTTNMPLDDFLVDDALFVITHDGRPLHPDHGGPIRLVVPRLYAWKSAKWVRGVELLARDQAGFWERGGYHMRGDPWAEQRYR